jgi:hypothetical protein
MQPLSDAHNNPAATNRETGIEECFEEFVMS